MTIAFDAGIRPAPRLTRTAASSAQSVASTRSVTVLTARGRFVVWLVVACALALGAILLGSTVAATQDAGVSDVVTVVVRPGDTLWAIATEANPGGDIRQTISEITRLNALEKGSSLPVGKSLSIPVYR